MTAARPSSAPTPHGASPVGGGNRGRGRKGGLLLGALLLAALVAAVLLLSQCGGTDDPAGGTDAAGSTSSGSARSSASDPAASDSSASPSAEAGASGSGELVTADGQSVLDVVAQPDPATALGGLSGQSVTGTGVEVLSVPADEGFWIGSSDQQRVWVQLTGQAGESPYQVTEGDTVDLEGTVVAHDQSFAQSVGLAEADGAAQLTSQGSHLEVEKSAVRVSS